MIDIEDGFKLIKADLTFFEKDFKNKTEKDFKIIDRIIQNLREKLCFLLEKNFPYM